MNSNPLALLKPSWWRETETPRWVLAAGAVLTVVLTLFGTNFLENRARTNDNRAQQIQSLVDSMIQFQTFASAFSTEMFAEGAVDTETRSRLIANLNEQHTRVRNIATFINGVQKSDLASYQADLLKMIESTQKTDDLMSMKDFWATASKLTVARNRLSAQLQKQI